MEVVAGRATVAAVEDFVATVEGVGADHDVAVQAFDARYVVDRTHLERAVALADRALGRGEGIARDRGVEILCYAAGRRQIDRAMEMGVGAGTGPVAIVVAAESGAGEGARERERAAAEAVRERLGGQFEPADVLGAHDPAIVREFFGIGDAELGATAGDLADLVHERVALLVVER